MSESRRGGVSFEVGAGVGADEKIDGFGVPLDPSVKIAGGRGTSGDRRRLRNRDDFRLGKNPKDSLDSDTGDLDLEDKA